MRTLPLLALVGCSAVIGIDDEAEGPPPPLALTIEEPVHLSFAGDVPEVVISGRVSAPTDEVWIEGRLANVGSDGGFHVALPVGEHLRVFTVEAIRADERLVEHRTVFAGHDPLASWPGALPLRVTPTGLQHLGEVLAAQIDALDLAGQISAAIPTFEVSGFGFTSSGGTAGATEVSLTASDAGLALALGVPDLELAFDVDVPVLGPIPGVLGLDRLDIGANLVLGATAGAATVGVTDTTVELGVPVLRFAGLESGLLETLSAGLVDGLGLALEVALDSGALALGDLVLPGGTIETEALGFPLALELAGLGTDDDGVVASLGVDLGIPAPGVPHLPTLAEGGPGADFELSLHEGLLAGLLSSDLLAALDLGTIELPAFLGEIVALPLANLPGGSELPADRTGMCLTLGVPQTGVGRVHPGLDPIGRLLLPDLQLDVAVTTPTVRCSPWLSTELALSASLTAEDTSLVVGLDVIDGAVLSYAVEGDWTEDEVVAGLGGLIDATSSLLGTSLAIDLSTLIDPTLLGGTPRISWAGEALDAAGQPVPGTIVVGLSLR